MSSTTTWEPSRDRKGRPYRSKQQTVVDVYSELTGVGGVAVSDPKLPASIVDNEDLFKTMPVLTYHVTKVNQWGKHQPRVLRLSSAGIENVRTSSSKVSSVHSYAEVEKVFMRDMKTLAIRYEGAKHDFVYRSPVAMQILQEIQMRASIRRATDMKKKAVELAAAYQENVKLARMLDPPGGYRSSDPIAMPIHHTSNNTNTSSLVTISSATSSMSDGGSSPPFRDSDGSDEGKAPPRRRGNKLLKLLGDTGEQRLDTEVSKIMLNPSTPEGKAVAQFFHSELASLLKNPQDLGGSTRGFMDDLRQYILANRGDLLGKLLALEPIPQDAPEDGLSTRLSTTINFVLEKIIVQRHYAAIISSMSQVTRPSDDDITLRIKQLKSKTQLFYGVRADWLSPTNWTSAVLELSSLGRAETPTEKLQIILATAKAINTTFDYENNRNRKPNTDPSYLSADDFLPIFIFVLVNSDVAQHFTLHDFLWQLADPDQLTGESGYYLTVYSSAINLILSLMMDDPAQVRAATVIDTLIPPSTFGDDLASDGNVSSSEDEDTVELSPRLSSKRAATFSSSDPPMSNEIPVTMLIPNSSPAVMTSAAVTTWGRRSDSPVSSTRGSFLIGAATQRSRKEDSELSLARPRNRNAIDLSSPPIFAHQSSVDEDEPFLLLPSDRRRSHARLQRASARSSKRYSILLTALTIPDPDDSTPPTTITTLQDSSNEHASDSEDTNTIPSIQSLPSRAARKSKKFLTKQQYLEHALSLRQFPRQSIVGIEEGTVQKIVHDINMRNTTT
eukprot:TRINITY_DN3229_c0_g1_i2.p1 TRINITY_DN3229_c0_g1~~TRINITY_DN3229_c0_g1_i2.p1  ORF type:complete len:785 (-),score=160.34 TRINITY_DN3229_c0_g1_i2:80-2434(-)